MKGHISRTADIRKHFPTGLSMEKRRRLLTDTNQRTGRFYFKSQKSIFTYQSIYQSIDRYINVRTKCVEGHISRTANSSTYLLTDISTETWRTHWFIDTTMKWLLRPLTSRLVNMVPPVDQRKVAGSTVYDKAVRVMAEDECNRLYGSHKKVNMVEGFFYVDQNITKQRRKQFYVIYD